MQIEELYKLYLAHPSVETDTRKIKSGSIFFALKGPTFNGNDYAQQALDKGASYCVVDELRAVISDRVILVEDCLAALQSLAKKHRQTFNIPFIGITGSNGKTTTKELVHAVLSSTANTYTTTGNLNNHIGVPLTILKVKQDAEFAVVEMGANHLREIAGYCEYALPTHGLITNCGKAHLEGFGSEAAIKIAKGELFDHLRQHDGTAFLYADYDYLIEMSAGIKTVVRYGSNNGDAMVCGKANENSDLLEVIMTKGTSFQSVRTNLVGSYNLPNVLAAITIGKTFGIPEDAIKSALENYQPSNSRSQLLEKDNNQIILDAYNANPSSMQVAIENFAARKGNNKVVILGAMMEMGDASKEEHMRLVKQLEKDSWRQVVLVGEDFRNLSNNYRHFSNVSEAADWYRKQSFRDMQILIKGSRSMQMERLLD